jgi:renalase
MSTPLEIAIVGAGMTGIACANQLQASGRTGIVIFEKSRGVGGRLTTRRMHDTCVDRGTCYISPKGDQFRSLFQQLIANNIVEPWTDITHNFTADGRMLADANIYPRYVAPGGMNQIAKYLARDLDVKFGQKVTAIEPNNNLWKLTIENNNEPVLARTIILAIPAPQAVDLLSPLTDILPMGFLNTLSGVDFYPSIAVAAGYTMTQLAQWDSLYPQVKSVSCLEDPILSWVGVDSTKRHQPASPVFVIQSTANFAAEYPQPEDMVSAGQIMLERASERFLPWFRAAQWQEPHIWRYAFPKSPLVDTLMSIDLPAPLYCTGDWCRGRKVEDAYLAGLSMAEHLITASKYPRLSTLDISEGAARRERGCPEF